MPLFFFISGLCFSAKRKPVEFVKAKARTLLVPWLFFTVIWIAFKCALGLKDGALDFEFFKNTVLAFLLQKRQYAIWYLTAVFLLEICFYAVLKLCREKTVAVWVVTFLILAAGIIYKKRVGINLYWELDIVPFAAPFFALGYYLKRFKGFKIKKKLPAFILAAALFVLGQGINCFNCKLFEPHFVSMFNNEYSNYLLFYLSALCGVFATVIISRLLENHFSYIKYVGKNSLVFFGTHQMLFILLERVLSGFSLSAAQLTLIWLAEFVLSFVVLTPINELLTKTKLKIFLGKKNTRN